MVCLDLVGSPLGGPDIAEELRDLVVVSGAERAGLGALVDDTPTEGVTLRRIGADIVPPLSDHFAFHSAGIPTMFLTSGRNRYYHTPEDTPEKLDYPMMADLADAFTDIVVRTSRREAPIVYRPDVVDRETSIATILDLMEAAADLAPDGGRMLAIMDLFAAGRGSEFFAGHESEALAHVLRTAESALG